MVKHSYLDLRRNSCLKCLEFFFFVVVGFFLCVDLHLTWDECCLKNRSRQSATHGDSSFALIQRRG